MSRCWRLVQKWWSPSSRTQHVRRLREEEQPLRYSVRGDCRCRTGGDSQCSRPTPALEENHQRALPSDDLAVLKCPGIGFPLSGTQHCSSSVRNNVHERLGGLAPSELPTFEPPTSPLARAMRTSSTSTSTATMVTAMMRAAKGAVAGLPTCVQGYCYVG